MRLSSKGLEDLIKSMDELTGSMPEVMHKAVYNAAGKIATEVKQGLEGLPVQEGANGKAPYVRDGEKLHGVTASQKQDLINALGIAPHKEENGAITTSIGFDGYGSTPTKKYPRGIPNRMLMRSVESGTSFRQKHPVIRPALNRVRKQAAETLKSEVIKEIKKEI